MSKRPTLSDVAKLCGVTPATVSRVLNAKRSFSASPEVRERILKTAHKIGYVPDLAARNLNRRQTHIVGLFASPRTNFAEGISEQLLEGIAAVLQPAGYDVFFGVSTDAANARPLPFWRFDGAVLLQAPPPETVEELDRRRVPYVCVNEHVGNPAASVLADDAAGIRAALDHLAQLGHRRVAYVNARHTYLPHYSIRDRADALAVHAQALGIELVPGHAERTTSIGGRLRTSVVEGRATAVIAYDHQLAVELLAAAHELRLGVPTDFSLVCFNDLFPVALTVPALTAIAVDGRAIGREGAALLLETLNAEAPPPHRLRRVAETLVIRASTAAPARD